MLRALGLTPVEQELYESLVPGRPATLAEITELAVDRGWGSHTDPALNRLCELGLVTVTDTDPPRYSAAPPDTAMQTLLLSRRLDLARARQRATALRTQFRGGRATAENPMVEVVRGRTAMSRWLAAHVHTIRHHIDGFDAPPYVNDGQPRVDEPQVRGNVWPGTGPDGRQISHRYIFSPAAMLVSGRLEAIATEPRRPDQQVRVADVPVKMFLVDGRTGILPFDHVTYPIEAMLIVRGRPLLAALGLLFEIWWERAVPLYIFQAETEAGSRSEADGYAHLSDTHRELLSMLVAGFTDKAIAEYQGWTDRTVRRWTHDLLERLDAQTRFQAGYQAVARGWVTASAEDRHAQ